MPSKQCYVCITQRLGLSLLPQVEGQKIIVHKTPGWVFGDIALLFNSPRSASIEAATNIQLWAMERRVFLKVRYHQQKSGWLQHRLCRG